MYIKWPHQTPGCERGSDLLRPSEPVGGMGVLGEAHTPISNGAVAKW